MGTIGFPIHVSVFTNELELQNIVSFTFCNTLMTVKLSLKAVLTLPVGLIALKNENIL